MKKQNVNTKINLFIYSLLIIVVMLTLAVSYTNSLTNDLSYDKFMKMAKNKEIDSVLINLSDSTFIATDTNDKEYIVDNPKYDNFKKDLLEYGINVKENKSMNYINYLLSFLQIGIMIFIAYSFFKAYNNQTNGSSGEIIINNTDNSISENKDGKTIVKRTTFDNVAGLKQIKSDLSLLVDFLKDPNKYVEAGAKLPKGVILCGPPGTGKTLLAKAIAGEANVPFFSVNGSDFIEMYVGVGAKRVRKLFEDAKKQSPCIVFIDEIDAIGGKRDSQASGGAEHRQTINALLAKMDGFIGNEGILVIAATNRIDDLDPALIRPGRFDKHITVPLPDTPEERLEIIHMYANNKKFAEDVDFKLLAKETIGFSPADIESLLNESALISVQNNLNYINKKCIDDAIYKKLLRGHAKDDKNRDEEELKLVAWHEAGHATIAKLCNMDVSKVTIVKSTSGAGGVNIIVPKKMGLYSIEELSNQVKMCYGGRCGEKLLYNNDLKLTTGASADIQQATNIIYQMITMYGMDNHYGLLNLNDLHVDSKIILDEAIKLSKKLENETFELLNKYKDMHQEIVNILLEKETIDGNELDIIYKKYI